jgi:DNA helicase TIP49 (TBP-interacting protein)
MGTEKSHLFFLTSNLHPRNSFAERIGQELGKAGSFLSLFGHLITLLENRRVKFLRKFFRRACVLKTASGFQGE